MIARALFALAGLALMGLAAAAPAAQHQQQQQADSSAGAGSVDDRIWEQVLEQTTPSLLRDPDEAEVSKRCG
ncbi:MAG: hypothetical protein INR71_05380 [Terriglobus roseus]|nr:hypothetical protein [Terriglobus roseus]